MSFFRDLLADLVSTRLWPLALILVGGLVAVPLALSKSVPVQPAVVAADNTGPVPGQPVIQVTGSVSHKAALLGKPHDPFKQLFLPKGPGPGGTGAPGPMGAGGSGSPAGGSGGGGTSVSSGGGGALPAGGGSALPGGGGGLPGHGGGGSIPAPIPTPSPHGGKPTYDTASIDVRFGPASDHLRTYRNLARLSPLPSPSQPVVTYLGLLSDKRTAVFLVSAYAHPQPDSACHPSKRDCQTLHMRAGDTELLDVSLTNGGSAQFELDLLGIHHQRTTSAVIASAAYNRTSDGGRQLLHEHRLAGGFAQTLRFSPAEGTLFYGPDAARWLTGPDVTATAAVLAATAPLSDLADWPSGSVPAVPAPARNAATVPSAVPAPPAMPPSP